jgi:hypothetical protein
MAFAGVSLPDQLSKPTNSVLMKKSILASVAAAAATLTAQAQVTLGIYEFTDNSLAVTDLNGGDGITFSDLSINSYTTDEAFSDAGDLVADPTLDYISLNGIESPNGTGTAFTDGLYLSFTINNNSGSTLDLLKFTGDFDKVNVFQQFQSRVFDTATPASVTDDTITKLGATSGGTGLEQDEALLDGTSGEAGANWAGVSYTIPDSASVTFYLPYNMNSNSDTRYMGIDNIAIVVPEPTTFALAGLGLAGLVVFRRRS